MKTTLAVVTISVLATGLLGAVAGADPARDPVINHRQARQWKEIRQGIRSDDLTRRETARLIDGERDIARDERAAKSDCRFTARERLHIQRELNQERREIFRLK